MKILATPFTVGCKCLLITVLMTCSVLTVNANTANIDLSKFPMPDYSKQRSIFLTAEKTLWRMDNKDLANTVEKLADYPLIPYLIERKLSHKLSLADEQQVRAFLTLYADTPLASKVRRNWLTYLAKKNKAALFIEFYEPTSNVTLACSFIDFQIEQGVALSVLYNDIAKLWTVGVSQPKRCDGIFDKWIDAGQMSEDLVLLRIKKAADGGRHTLIPYLRKLLPKNKQYLADLWHKTRRDPAVVKNLKLFTGKYPLIEAEIVSYGLSRLIWRDQDLALKTMLQAEKQMTFNQVQKALIYGKFGVKLAIDGHKDAETWLMKAELEGDDPSVMRWHLAYLLRKQDWAKLILLIAKSDAQKVAEKDYSYWLARAYEELGRDDEAQVLYEQLATYRHYYGFLASARINKPYQLEHASVEVSDELIKKTLGLASSQRAYELRALNRHHEARLEWRKTQNALEDDEKLVSTVISSAWGWYDQAIFTFSREGYLNDVPRRFPMAFEDLIIREANKNDIDPEWAFAIARRESSFMPDAVSPADARGLMQVLPSTAKYLEKKRVSARQLLDVETNAKIGNKYLRYLMDMLDDNTVLATASYNAGWRRVKQWLPENEALEADIWVELIPYKETRNYVKAVLAYKQIYEAQLRDKQPSDTALASAKAKVFVEFINTDIPTSL